MLGEGGRWWVDRKEEQQDDVKYQEVGEGGSGRKKIRMRWRMKRLQKRRRT